MGSAPIAISLICEARSDCGPEFLLQGLEEPNRMTSVLATQTISVSRRYLDNNKENPLEKFTTTPGLYTVKKRFASFVC